MQASVQEYITQLKGKGFILGEDVVSFIEFGKHYTGANDEVVNASIEITLKAQKEFDGSFYLALLETLMEEENTTRKKALNKAIQLQLI
ncbi:DUF6123 family protein [Metabacillus arenae]|uniref:Group-specific protein n=1 Tax=Metabacillus arenae TaxID=2771434 RepID=A0A926RYX7_9BACI|nr:DUF6123 family protein [Metabacillus arenae]MBD1381632.1 hypothetical protein [Metabacillus arenae]